MQSSMKKIQQENSGVMESAGQLLVTESSGKATQRKVTFANGQEGLEQLGFVLSPVSPAVFCFVFFSNQWSDQ